MWINKSFFSRLSPFFFAPLLVFIDLCFRLVFHREKKMLGGPAGDDEANKQMANSQVKSSFIQFIVAVGLINIGTRRSFE